MMTLEPVRETPRRWRSCTDAYVLLSDTWRRPRVSFLAGIAQAPLSPDPKREKGWFERRRAHLFGVILASEAESKSYALLWCSVAVRTKSFALHGCSPRTADRRQSSFPAPSVAGRRRSPDAGPGRAAPLAARSQSDGRRRTSVRSGAGGKSGHRRSPSDEELPRDGRRNPPQAVFARLQPARRAPQRFLYGAFGRPLESGMGECPVLVSLQRSRAGRGDLLRKETGPHRRASDDPTLLDGPGTRPDPFDQSVSAGGRGGLGI